MRPDPLDAHNLPISFEGNLDPEILKRASKLLETSEKDKIADNDESSDEETDEIDLIQEEIKEIEDIIDKTGKKCNFSKYATRIAEETSDAAAGAPQIEIQARKALMLKIQPFIQENLKSIYEKASAEERSTIDGRIKNKQKDFSAEIKTSLRHGSPELGFFKRWWNGPISEEKKFKAGFHDAATLFMRTHFKMPIIDPEQEPKIRETVKKAVEHVGKEKNLISPNISL